MADKLQQSAQGATDQAKKGASEGQNKWDAMSEDQKKQTFDKLPADQKKGKTYYEWITEGYHHQYENWMPWVEDVYLKWFSKDNKASYATKDTLDKSKITGIEQVDTLQDGVNNLVGGQFGQGGLLQPVGDMASKEGINRAERGGKDEKGSYGAGYGDSAVNSAKSAGEGVSSGAQSVAGSASSGAQSAGNSVLGGAKSAGGYVGGMFGGGKKEEAK